MVTEDDPKSGSNKRIYLRMFLFAMIGFVLFFYGAWLRLIQVGAFRMHGIHMPDPRHY